MSQVEDMSGSLLRSPQHIAHPFFDCLPGSEQERRIEIALYAALIADSRPGLIQVHAPIHADNIAASLGHQFEQTGRAGAEVDGRRARLFDGLKNAPRIWLREAVVDAGNPRPHPA